MPFGNDGLRGDGLMSRLGARDVKRNVGSVIVGKGPVTKRPAASRLNKGQSWIVVQGSQTDLYISDGLNWDHAGQTLM